MHDLDASRPVKICYIGGGSLEWARKLMADLAYDTRLAAHVRLYDIDYEAAQRNAEIGARFAAVSRGTPARYEAVKDLGKALDGADVVVISILPGAFDLMAQDISIPEGFGIPHAVGDTVGPAGFVRAIRAIPMMAEFAAAIAAHAPNAFVCNLTNPMSTLTGALFKVFPDIRAWGECHEVTKIRKQVAWIANQSGQKDVTFRDVEVNVLGINHFTFVDRIHLNGQDMRPAYEAFVQQHAVQGWAQSETRDPEKAKYFDTRNLVAFDMLRRFGIPAAAGDRHLVEFMPAADYMNDPAQWGFNLTPVSFRIRERAERIKQAEALRRGDIAPMPARSDEAMMDQIAALMGGEPFVSNVNLPNAGQMPDLPAGTVVETNARFAPSGITPLHAGQLPQPLLGIVADHAARQSALVEAVIAGDPDALFPLFRTDPLVAPLSETDAHRLFSQMLAATASLIPDALRGAA